MFLHFPDSPTHYSHSGATPSTFNLLFTKGFPSPINITVDSDHCSVMFELTDTFQLSDIPYQVVRDFTSANWRRFARTAGEGISSIGDEPIDSVGRADHAVALLTQSVVNVDRDAIPRKKRQFGTFGLPSVILALIRERRAATRR